MTERCSRLVQVALLLSMAGVAAEEPAESLFDLDLAALMQVRVQLGSRHAPVALADSPVPIQVVTRDELRRTGQGELGKALDRLLPMLVFPRASLTDGTDHARPFALRGLGADQVLVLINGKRLHQGALVHVNNSLGRGGSSVDLNTIPLASIERVELMPMAASAQYGSDALAGIINLVLRREDDSASVHTGFTGAGDGQLRRVTIAEGWHQDQSALQLHLEWRDRDALNRAGIDRRPYYFDGDPRNTHPAFSNQVTFHYGDPAAEDRYLQVQAEHGSASEAWYALLNANQRHSSAGAFYRTARDNRTVRALYPDGFTPQISADIDDRHVQLGKKMVWRDWQTDLSLVAGDNRFAFGVDNSVNVSLGLDSPLSFDAGTLRNSQQQLAWDWQRQSDATNKLAFGIEWLQERYRIAAGDLASWQDGAVPILDGPNAGAIAPIGSQGFPGFRPENEVDTDRERAGVYGEWSQTWQPAWTSTLALRHEQHSTFGSTTDGRLGLQYRYSPALQWRFAASTGYHAPSLAQSHFSSISTVFVGNDSFDIGTFAVDHPLAQALGARALEPERSRQYGIGVSWSVSDDWRLAVDCYQQTIDDRIVLSGEITRDAAVFGDEVAAILDAYNVSGARFFMNIIGTRSQGCDLDNLYQWQFVGLWQWRFKYHWHENDLHGDVQTPPLLTDVGQRLFDLQEQVRYTDGQPGNNLDSQLDWSGEPWHLMLRLIRTGAFRALATGTSPTVNQRFDARWYADLELSYLHRRAGEFALGVQNLFDEYPEPYEDFAGLSFHGRTRVLPYSQQSPLGFEGDFYYLRWRLTF